MKRVRHGVQVGDRFRRPRFNPTIYVLTELVERPGHPPHARLTPESGTGENMLLVSIAALAEGRLFIPVEAA